jgi:hypothetical protein
VEARSLGRTRKRGAYLKSFHPRLLCTACLAGHRLHCGSRLASMAAPAMLSRSYRRGVLLIFGTSRPTSSRPISSR